MSQQESNDALEVSNEILAKCKIDGLLVAMRDYFRRYFAQHDLYNPPQEVHKMFLSKIESILIKAALDFTGGKKSMAADILGMNRNTLRSKIKDLKI